ncbi:short chain dehydrogenase [uncultured Roseibium sp.]|uniref:short chain dehydrogenase n=1 Tax=uncultured Roseibium sp. TaxID=1936171 RepID=UPI00263A347A|nr:short chain dehydrogenase [uncultured Roseibium sp.]
MKIILVGASGDVGKAAYDELSARHDVITASRSSGDVRVDLTSPESIRALYEQTGPVDAVISAAGEVEFARISDMTVDKFRFGLENKALSQISLVLGGLDRVREGGSFTLTSGILDRDPVLLGAGAATANGALAGFVKSAAIDLPKGRRINVVSPGLLEVSADQYGAWFPGHELVSSRRVGLAYAKCVEGAITGQVVPVD